MYKQLNGPILKSLKTKRSGPKSEKKGGPGSGQNFVFRFRPARARTEIINFPSRWVGFRPKFFSLLRAGPEFNLD